MAGSYVYKLRPLYRCSNLISNRVPTLSSHQIDFSYRNRSSNGNDKRSKNRVSEVIAGLCLSLGLYKYIRENATSFSCSQVFRLPIVEAFSIPNKKDDSKTGSPRNNFNFLADVVEKTAPSVVYIEIKARHPITMNYISMSNGSGFIIKADGLILTNAHVVANQPNVTVKLQDGREFRGIVEDIDNAEDLATVRIKAENLPVLKLGKSSDLRVGEFVIAMGNPLSLSHTITSGVISSTHRPSKELGLHRKTDYIQTDAAINVGNSGGPLINLDCEAIGINTMKVTEGISFAIPSDSATEFLKRIEEKKAKGWGKFGKETSKKGTKRYIGIVMLTLTPQIIQEFQQRQHNFPSVQRGVMVWRVTVGSPACEGGLRPGDIITDVNGKKVNSSQDIYEFLETTDVLDITIVRGTVILDIVVHPQEMS